MGIKIHETTRLAIERAADDPLITWLAPEFREKYVAALTAALNYGLTVQQAAELLRPVLLAGRTEVMVAVVGAGED